MPALALVIFDERHVIGEHPPEPRVGEQPGAFVRGDPLYCRLDGESGVLRFVDFADHALPPFFRLGD